MPSNVAIPKGACQGPTVVDEQTRNANIKDDSLLDEGEGLALAIVVAIMRMFLCVGISLTTTSLWAADIDVVQGFRDVSFGSGAVELPFKNKTESNGLETDVKFYTVASSELKEKTFFGRLIEQVEFAYWENQLFNVTIMLQPSSSTQPGANQPETAALWGVRLEISALYGRPFRDRIDLRAGTYYVRWSGEKTSVTFSGERQLKRTTNGLLNTCSFRVELTSLPLLQAKLDKARAQRSAETAARKDGF